MDAKVDQRRDCKATLLAKCVFLLAMTMLWLQPALAASVGATKDCTVSPCTITGLGTPIVIKFAQTISWQATYTGSATDGHSFYLTTSPLANKAQFLLTKTGQGSGSLLLQPGTYYISISLAVMGPGMYAVAYDSSLTGDPHITTVDGTHYDFQAAGEFVALVQNPTAIGPQRGTEVQVRHSPVSTASRPGPGRNGLSVCVSVISAVAARVGTHRVTYEPNLSGVPDPTGLQLRIDGNPVAIGASSINLGSGGRVARTSAPGGIEINFPDGTDVLATPGWWVAQSQWYLNIELSPTVATHGTSGKVPPESWIPGLPDGTSVGAQPESLHDRYTTLYTRFSDAWRVKANSLFDYAPNTSTDTFSLAGWPSESGSCTIPGAPPAQTGDALVANQACDRVDDKADCIFDVIATGNPGFATTYAVGDTIKIQPNQPATRDHAYILIVLGCLLFVLLVVVVFVLMKRRP